MCGAQPTRYTTLWAEKVASRAPRVCVTPPPRPLRRSWPRRRPWRGGPTCSVRTCLNGQDSGATERRWNQRLRMRLARAAKAQWPDAQWTGLSRPGSAELLGAAGSRPEKAREPRAGALPGGSIRSAALPQHPRHTAAPPKGGATLVCWEPSSLAAHCLWWGEEGAA